MSLNDVSVVLVHGAWADGSSWSKVIGPLRAEGIRVVAAPLLLTTLADDVAALDRTLERIEGPIVLVGHAYAGAVIAATRDAKVKSLVYVAALAPDQGETVADVFYRAAPHPQARAHARPGSSWRDLASGNRLCRRFRSTCFHRGAFRAGGRSAANLG
jgi:pimeloyl-ACP methyl ester carboxylesterase